MVGAHQYLATVGAELAGAVVQAHGEMRAAVAVAPDLAPPAHQHQGLGAAVQLGVQGQGTAVGDGVQGAEVVHPRSSGLPRPQCQ
ncbi:hypothetical protein D9M71_843410 [compost metagenome]